MGDQVLQRVAEAVKAEFRPYDGIGRFGGDEFVLVLPGLDESEARHAAERLQAVVAAAPSEAAPGGGLTASVGIARWREPLAAAELLDRADRALLLAKRRGKNQAVLADRETESELARLESRDGGPGQIAGRPVGHGERVQAAERRAGSARAVRPRASRRRRRHADRRPRSSAGRGDAGATGRRRDHSRQPSRPAQRTGRPGSADSGMRGLLRRARAGARWSVLRHARDALGRTHVPLARAARGRAARGPGGHRDGRAGQRRLAIGGGRAGGRDRRARQLHPLPFRAGGVAGV